MENPNFIAIALFIVSPILVIIALAVRFAGNSRPLNIVDYNRVEDATSLHRWTGNRLAILPATSLILGYVSFQNSRLSLLLLGLFIAIVLVVGAWVALGAERFQDAR